MNHLRLASPSLLILLFASIAFTTTPACAPGCPDTAPEPGSSCSGDLRCGATEGCGTAWSCNDGKWDVTSVACEPPDGFDVDAATDSGDTDGS